MSGACRRRMQKGLFSRQKPSPCGNTGRLQGFIRYQSVFIVLDFVVLRQNFYFTLVNLLDRNGERLLPLAVIDQGLCAGNQLPGSLGGSDDDGIAACNLRRSLICVLVDRIDHFCERRT